MATHVEPRRTGEHVLSEANGSLSRDEVTLAAGNLKAGTIVAKNTAGDYVQLAPAGANGTNIAAGVLYAATDATDDPVKAVVHNFSCEVSDADIVWPDAITGAQKITAITNLRAVGIKVR